MASLNDALTIARSGVLAHQERLAIISHNIVNVHTEGYHRQRAVLGTNPENMPNIYQTRRYSIGTGVTVIDVVRDYNIIRERAILPEESAASYHNILGSMLPDLEGLLKEGGLTSINETLRGFFEAWQDVAVNPENLAMRNVLLERSGQLTDAFNLADAYIVDYRATIARISGPDFVGAVPNMVDRINDLATMLQDVNVRIELAELQNTTANDLMDRRDQYIRELSRLVNITVDADNTVQMDGEVLVSGDGVVRNDFEISSIDPLTFNVGGSAVYTIPGSMLGELGGYVELDNIASTLRNDITTLANEVVTQVNTLHLAGFDLDGNAGLDFFTGTTAANITVNPALYNPTNPLLNNPRLVAASTTQFDPLAPLPTVGDGAQALAIADLFYMRWPALDNQTFSEFFTGLTTLLGSRIASEVDAAQDGTDTVQFLNEMILSESGVSLDDELIEMISAQRAYQASAKLVSVVDGMFDTLFAMKR